MSICTSSTSSTLTRILKKPFKRKKKVVIAPQPYPAYSPSPSPRLSSSHSLPSPPEKGNVVVDTAVAGDVKTEKMALNGHVGADALTNGDVEHKGHKKELILNAFVEMCSGHQSPGLWRHPADQSHKFNDLSHWTELAKLLERGKLHGVFIADVLGGYDVYGGPRNLEPAIRSGAQWPVNEPLAVVPAMAAVTKHLGFGVTVSTTYERPYHLARRLSTVDHLTKGRLAWNVVTGYLESAARNLGHEKQMEHDERYKVCEEYMDVMYKLWNSSWRTDAVRMDRKQGIYTDPQRVREINHKGKYFDVPGPHLCQPSPQRTPVIMQAGTSRAGKAFASRHAEAIFVSAHSPAACAQSVKDIREQAALLGRDPASIKFLAKICPILGRTEAEAKAKYDEYLSYGDYDGALALFGGWTGVDLAQYGDEEELRYVESNAIRSYIEGLVKHAPKVGTWTKKTVARDIIVGGLGATPIGTPSQVADEFERWVEEADVDGFNIAYAIFPQTFEDVIEMLLPELRKRGLFWSDYVTSAYDDEFSVLKEKSGTYRENLNGTIGAREPRPDHPAAAYIWRAGTAGAADTHIGGDDALSNPSTKTQNELLDIAGGPRLTTRKSPKENGVNVTEVTAAITPTPVQETKKKSETEGDELSRKSHPQPQSKMKTHLNGGNVGSHKLTQQNEDKPEDLLDPASMQLG